MSHSILVIEDEEDLAHILIDYLRFAGFTAEAIHDGRQAQERLAKALPDLVLLDLMLPGVDGLTLLRELRAHSVYPDVPVILVTARVEEVDRLVGLESGADDYICKPFSPREVVARIKTVLRRSRASAAPARPAADQLTTDPQTLRACYGAQRLDLTPKEFELIHILIAHPGRVFSRAQLLERLQPDNFEVSERAIDSHMKNLRRKLAQIAPAREMIRSVYGVGFVYEG
ncbi:MAG: response regulator [Sulfuricella sp.]|nr:response regulator [Sulfuricella sp.]